MNTLKFALLVTFTAVAICVEPRMPLFQVFAQIALYSGTGSMVVNV
jgi:hypothetical protein